MLSPTELLLNRIAQGHTAQAEGLLWFQSKSSAEQQAILLKLSQVCQQSHPTPQEASQAIGLSSLKASFTPCVLLRNATLPENAFQQILGLPLVEKSKSFRLLLALFTVSDTRRRQTQCKNGCSHEWHHLPAP